MPSPFSCSPCNRKREVENHLAWYILCAIVFSIILSGTSSASAPHSNAVGGSPVKVEPIHSQTKLDQTKLDQTKLSRVLNETVGTAISPLLVMCIKFATQTDSRTTKPILIVLCIFLLLTLLKDVLPVSLVKKPLDATEELSSPLPAIMGLLIILPDLIHQFTPAAAESIQTVLNELGPSTAYAADSANSGAANVSSVSTLAQFLGGVVVSITGTITYCAVWLLSNTLTILCMIVPAALGPVVKSCRLGILGFLYTLNTYYPFLGLIVSIAIIIIAFLVCRWTFNLTVWGGIYSFDLLTLSWRRRKPGVKPIAFITGNGPKELKLAKRTMGRLSVEEGRLVFRYRHFLLLPKKIELPTDHPMVIGQRITAPMLMQRVDERLVPLLSFRLSCRTHEELLAQNFGGLEIAEVGLSKWFKGAWAWLDSSVPQPDTQQI